MLKYRKLSDFFTLHKDCDLKIIVRQRSFLCAPASSTMPSKKGQVLKIEMGDREALQKEFFSTKHILPNQNSLVIKESKQM